MALYLRRPAFGFRERTRIVKGEGLSFAIKDDPLSPHFTFPASANTQTIWNYLASTQIRQYGKIVAITENTRGMCMRHIKQALEKWDHEFVYRAIRYTSMVSRHPFTIPTAIRIFENVGSEFNRLRKDQKPDKLAAGFDFVRAGAEPSRKAVLPVA